MQKPANYSAAVWLYRNTLCRNFRGTIVGTEGDDWIIYTHNHFDQTKAGVKLSDARVQAIEIYNYDKSSSVHLLKTGPDPDVKVEENGQRTRLKVRSSMLDGTGGLKLIGKPINREDGAMVNVDNEVSIAYFAPDGPGSDNVAIWHTRVVDRHGIPPNTVAVLGVPTPLEALGPGAPGDSGGGLFRNGKHIGNTWEWVVSGKGERDVATGKIIKWFCHDDAYWISYLNP